MYGVVRPNRQGLGLGADGLYETAAQEIQRFPGEYKDVAMAMVQRVRVKLGGKEKEPDDFNSAFGVAQQHFATAQDIKKELDNLVKKKGPADEIAKLTVFEP